MNLSSLNPAIRSGTDKPVEKPGITPHRLVIQATDQGGSSSDEISARNSSQCDKTILCDDKVDEEMRAAEVQVILITGSVRDCQRFLASF